TPRAGRLDASPGPASRARSGEGSRGGRRRHQPDLAGNGEATAALPRNRRLVIASTDYLVQHVAEAPVIVAPCGERGRHSTEGGSIFPAVQNLLLAAGALGLGGLITNFPRPHEADLPPPPAIPHTHPLSSPI